MVVSRPVRLSLVFMLIEIAACGGGSSQDGGPHLGPGGTGGTTTVATGGGGATTGTGGTVGPGGLTVTYDPNGATAGTAPLDTTQYAGGQTVTVPGNTGALTYPGYAFIGWQTQADGSGKAYAPGATFAIGGANLTLYALWAGGYAYTVNHNDGGKGTIAQFVIGPNGALTAMPKPTVDAGGTDTRYIAVDPAGKYIYASNPAANNQQGTLTQLTIDQTNGSLSPMSPLTVPFPTTWNSSPGASVVHPTGNWLYFTNTQPGLGGAVSQFTIGATGDLTSPSLVMIGQNPGRTSPYGIAIDPSGKYAYVTATNGAGTGGVYQYTVDPTTGVLQPNPSSDDNVVATTPVTSLGWAQPWDIKVLQIASGEYAYVSNYDDGTVWELAVNPADGTLTPLGAFLVAPTTVCTCEAGGNNIAAMGIALHPSGKSVYVTFSCCSSLQSVAQFTVNQTDGTLSPMTPATVLSSGSSQSIAVESSGKYAYVTSGETGFASSSIAQYTIDQASGALSLMANPKVNTGGVGPSGIVTIGQ